MENLFHADRLPDRLKKREMSVDRTTIIEANLAPGGGHVMHLRQKVKGSPD